MYRGDARRIEGTLRKYPHENFEIVGYIETEIRVEKDRNYTKSFLILGYLENLMEMVLKSGV